MTHDLALTEDVHMELHEHPAAVYLAGLNECSRDTMKKVLKNVARILTQGTLGVLDIDWAAIRFQHAAALRARLVDLYAPRTVNKTVAATRGVIRAAWRLGWMDADNCQRVVDALKSVKVNQDPTGRLVTDEEVAALFRVCDNPEDVLGPRDAAIMALMYGAGMRRTEVAQMKVQDYFPTEAAIRIRGKGRKIRKGFLGAQALACVERWMDVRGEGYTGNPDAAMFYQTDNGKVDQTAHLSARRINFIVVKRMAQAGLDHLTPHDFRRTFATTLLDKGVDLGTVQDLMGHNSPTTTRIYDRRGDDRMKKAVDLLEIPIERNGET